MAARPQNVRSGCHGAWDRNRSHSHQVYGPADEDHRQHPLVLGAVGAVLWFIPGAITALGYVLGGLLLFITIVGAPFGVQSIKLAGLALVPFGKKIVTSEQMAAAFTPSMTSGT